MNRGTQYLASRTCLARCALALLALTLPARWAAAQDDAAKGATLKAGDPAPKLSIGKWVKGEPVKELEKGKVYVLEFWATWCGPCITAIPHVTKLQEQYKEKGLVVIGANIWERDDLSKVEPFVEKMGPKMGYTVGIEEQVPAAGGKPAAGLLKGRMAIDWMEAAGRNGIPCSFIVDRAGRVAWIGHPMAMDKPLAKVIDGTFDPKAQAEAEAKIADLSKQAFAAAQAKEFDKALELRDAIIALDPDQANAQKATKLSLLMMKGDAAAANALGGELVEAAAKNKDGLTAARTASMMLMTPNAAKADADLALRAAQLAYDLGDQSLAYQRLLAQAHANKKDFARAAELQEKVVAQVKGPLKDREQKALDEYKAAAGK